MGVDRSRSWDLAMGATPGPLDLRVPAASVEGRVPDALRGGRVLSNGPGWTRIGGHTAHPFDGHGYVRSLRLTADGGLHLQAAFVQTPSYVAERAAGTLQHRGLATNLPGGMFANLKRGPARNVANTTVMRWGDRVLAGWEAGAPHGLDPETLETRGEEHFGGAITGQATLAHMHPDPATGRLTLCSVAQGRRTSFTFRELDDQDAVLAEREVAFDGQMFAHDYALSPSYYVLGGNPLRFKPMALASALLGADTLMKAIATDLGKPGVLHLIPRDGGPVRTVRLPEPAFVVHFGNAFERDGDLVVDACAFSDFPFGEEFGYQGPDAPFDPGLPEARGPQRLLRITVPADGDEATWRVLTPHGVDFPRFHPGHVGRETPQLFGATRRDTRYSDPFDSIIGVDLEDPERPDQLWTAPDTTFVGEPLFVPAEGEDRAGHVLCILSDGLAARTTLAVFDAQALADGPVAAVPLPLLPVGLHGDWDAAG